MLKTKHTDMILIIGTEEPAESVMTSQTTTKLLKFIKLT